MKKVMGFTVLIVGLLSSDASADGGTGVQGTVLSRGEYDAFKVISNNEDFKFKAEARPAVDILVRRHEYAPHSRTGWHTHPGPVFITVLEGTLTVYESDDPCTPITVEAGQGYVDTGEGHIARNETDEPAVDMTVIIAPIDDSKGFRGELPKLCDK